MKIIALGNRNVILEASVQEVNMLAGKTLYEWNNYRESWDKALRPEPYST